MLIVKTEFFSSVIGRKSGSEVVQKNEQDPAGFIENGGVLNSIGAGYSAVVTPLEDTVHDYICNCISRGRFLGD